MTFSRIRRSLSFLALATAVAFSAWGVETQMQEHSTFDEFSKGQPLSTSIGGRGELSVAPEKTKRVEAPESLILDVAVDEAGAVYLATGDQGYVWRVSAKDELTTVARLPEPLVTALAFGRDGRLYAAGAPGGRVYALDPNESATTPAVFCETATQYVWDLLPVKDGSLLAATGAEGMVLRIDDDGGTSTLLDTDTKNVIDLFLAADDRLLAATHEKARIYEITDKDEATVVYEGKLAEGRALAQDKDGNLFFALNGARTVGLYTGAATATAAAQQNGQTAPGDPSKAASPGATQAAMALRRMARGPSGVTEAIVVKIDPKGFATLHWHTKDAPIHAMAMAPDNASLYVAAGSEGKLYRIDPDGDYAVLFGVEETMVTALERGADEYLLGASGGAALYDVSVSPEKEGVYLSPTIDAGSPATWGRLRCQTRFAKGDEIRIATRTGATEQADDALWHPWSEDAKLTNAGVTIDNPVARYLQYRVTLKQKSAHGPVVEAVEAFFLTRNLAPIIKTIAVEQGAAAQSKKNGASAKKNGRASAGHSAAAARLASRAKNGAKKKNGKPESVAVDPYSNSGKKKVAWDVSDPNGDDMTADVYYKAEDETHWKLAEEDVDKNELELNSKLLPDGKYRVKVVVTDEASNSYGQAETSELISHVFVIDNTEPTIDNLKASAKDKDRFSVSFEARDETSFLTDARFSIDAKDWLRLEPEDRVFDGLVERFSFTTEKLDAGEHTLAIIVTDSEGNTTISKSILRQ